MRQRMVAGCLLILLECVVAANGAGADLQVSVEPSQTTFASPQGVRLWVTIRNSGTGCQPLFIDPMFSRMVSPRRPYSIVTMTIRDSQGRTIQPHDHVDFQAGQLRPHELVLLNCGSSYGREVALAQIPWSYDLSSGQYTVRAHVRVPVASFYKNRDGQQQRLEALWEASGDKVRPCIRDAEGDSGETHFSISRGK
jgi:hypothetical protein